jgi:CheY-like chemotaxis protein
MSETSKYKNVLLLDDNELDNFVNKKILGMANFAKNIYVNTSPLSALEFLKNISLNRSFTDIYPEVIFIDLNMPQMDGFQFIQAVFALSNLKLPSSRMVILTSSVAEEDEIKARSISEDIIFLRKPLTEEMLAGI